MVKNNGVWVVYDYGNSGGAEAKTIHNDPVRAITFLEDTGYGHVAWWPYDLSLAEAIEAWKNEARKVVDGNPRSVD